MTSASHSPSAIAEHLVIFSTFGWTMPIHAPKLGFLVNLTPKWTAISTKAKKGTPLRESASFEPSSMKMWDEKGRRFCKGSKFPLTKPVLLTQGCTNAPHMIGLGAVCQWLSIFDLIRQMFFFTLWLCENISITMENATLYIIDYKYLSCMCLTDYICTRATSVATASLLIVQIPASWQLYVAVKTDIRCLTVPRTTPKKKSRFPPLPGSIYARRVNFKVACSLTFRFFKPFKP